ncbi:MAG: hypothetical protein AAGI53_16145 [Planctomycetota bacterium]
MNTSSMNACVACSAAVVWLGGCATAPRFSGIEGPTRETVLRAAEVGVDLSSGSPPRYRDRLVAKFDAGETVDFAELRFAGGLYLDPDSGAVFSGYASTAHRDGEPHSIHGVVDGRLQGPGVWCFEDGSIEMAVKYNQGELRGQILEFFPGGEMKLRAMAHQASPKGGVRVGEITVGSFKSGTYQRQQLGVGRFQVIREDGRTDRSNSTIAVPHQSGYMLFFEGMLGGERVYTIDSREIGQDA